MRPVFPLVVLVAATAWSCASAGSHPDIAQCEMDVAVRATREDVDDRAIEALFETADESCESDKQFVAVFNEALFNALDRKPRAFVHYFSIFRDRSLILDQIENPVHDSIPISRIIAQLGSVSPANQATYDELLNSLRVAARLLAPNPPA
jgi:hypothetical protein